MEGYIHDLITNKRSCLIILLFSKQDKIQQKKVLTSLLLQRDRTVFSHFVKLSPINRVEVGHTLADASSASDLFCSSETHFLSIRDEKNGSKENPHERKGGYYFPQLLPRQALRSMFRMKKVGRYAEKIVMNRVIWKF